MNNQFSGLPESGQRRCESEIYFDSFITSGDNSNGWGPVQLYPPNTEVYHQDTPANAVYMIERGMVKLTWVEPEGHEVIVGLRRRHWLLGAPAVFLERSHAFTVTTLTPCSLRCISSRGFLQLVSINAEFCQQLLRRLSEEIYCHGMKVAVFGCIPARDRLTRFLCELVFEQGHANGPDETQKPMRLQIPLKLRELAQLIAITPEHLSRLLRELELQGIIRRDKGWLILTDPCKFMSGQK
jgi:CRP-like cAMP-binding protein